MKKMALFVMGSLVMSIVGCNVMQASFLSSTKSKVIVGIMSAAITYGGYKLYKALKDFDKRSCVSISHSPFSQQSEQQLKEERAYRQQQELNAVAQAQQNILSAVENIKSNIEAQTCNLISRAEGNYDQSLQAIEVESSIIDSLSVFEAGREGIQRIYEWNDAVEENALPIYEQAITKMQNILGTIADKINSCLDSLSR